MICQSTERSFLLFVIKKQKPSQTDQPTRPDLSSFVPATKMSVFTQLCANSFLSITVFDHCVWRFCKCLFCTGYNCGGLGWEVLIFWTLVPPTLSLTHTNTHHKNTHILSLHAPRGVITVPIIIHASQGCSHADCHLDTHKHSNSHKPQLHFEPIDQGQIHELEVYRELLVLSFSITQRDAGSFLIFLLPE